VAATLKHKHSPQFENKIKNDANKLTWSEQPGRAGGKVDTRQIYDDKAATACAAALKDLL